MQDETTKQRKRSGNKIIAARVQFFEFNVEAEKPENALNRLRTRNRADLSPDMPRNAKLISTTWMDPSEEGAAWLIRSENLPHDPTGQTVHAWNGKELIQQKVPAGFTAGMFLGD